MRLLRAAPQGRPPPAAFAGHSTDDRIAPARSGRNARGKDTLSVQLSVDRAVNRAYLILTIALLAGLSAYLFHPTLFQDGTLVHGDNVHHGYSFLKFHHDILQQNLSPLWTRLIYGGHALFAEGQAGLSNPINYLVAWLLPPEFGHNLLHWLAMTAFGVGCYGLCRSLALSPPSSLFAALAAAFSSLAIHTNTSMIAVEAMVWVPWTMWAFESWLRDPRPGRAVLFGLATAMLVFSGYPHFLHGTVVYLLASLCSLLLGGSLRATIPRFIGTHWRSGLLAIAVCVALSSVQWLPLLELASLSHRSDGVGIVVNGTTEFLLRGLLYSTDNFNSSEAIAPAWFPNTGSLLVCLLASGCLVGTGSARVKGHIVATALLLILGFGTLSPLYRMIIDYNLIPGISSFRLMFPYFIMTVVGVAVLAASALDDLGRLARKQLSTPAPGAIIRTGALLLAWGALLYHFHTDQAPLANYLVAALGLAGFVLLAAVDRLRLYPLYACVLLLAEILGLKLAPFGTVETGLLAREPPAVSYIRSTPDHDQFKHYQLGLASLTFSNPYTWELGNRARGELNSLVASTNLIWGIPSFSGALALKSAPKPTIDEVVELELEGQADDRPGSRLMDILSVKWLSDSRRGITPSRHLVPIKDPTGNVIVWENPYARPLVQTYTQARFVANWEQALDALRQGAADHLHVEADPGEFAEPIAPGADNEIVLKTLKSSDTQYRFVANSEAGFWLFLADTWHPGWRARIDDQPVPVYRAQVLGKAIFVPPGKHGVKIYFKSASFRLGAAISAAALAGLLVYAAIACGRRRKILAQATTGPGSA